MTVEKNGVLIMLQQICESCCLCSPVIKQTVGSVCTQRISATNIWMYENEASFSSICFKRTVKPLQRFVTHRSYIVGLPHEHEQIITLRYGVIQILASVEFQIGQIICDRLAVALVVSANSVDRDAVFRTNGFIHIPLTGAILRTAVYAYIKPLVYQITAMGDERTALSLKIR